MHLIVGAQEAPQPTNARGVAGIAGIADVNVPAQQEHIAALGCSFSKFFGGQRRPDMASSA
jgi:hypothetical protein